MNKTPPFSNANPPRLAEAILRNFLRSRDRDTVTGDLLEEYREVVLLEVGAFRARLWYIRQVLTLMSFAGLWRLTVTSVRNARAFPHLWAAAAGTAEYIFVLWIPGHWGVTLWSSLIALMTITLGVGGATAIHSAADLSALWRVSRCWGVLFALALTATMLAGMPAPAGLVPAVIGILFAAGFHGAWGAGQVRAGTLAAIVSSLVGSLLTIAAVMLGSTSGVGRPHPPAEATFVLLALGTGAAVGSVDAMFASGLGRMLRRRTTTTQRLLSEAH